MTDTHRPVPPPIRPTAWLDDWITVWHAEIAALVTDREAQEHALRLLELWAEQARAAARDAVPAAGADEPPGPPAPAAAPAADGAGDPRDRLIAELRARIAELERGS